MRVVLPASTCARIPRLSVLRSKSPSLQVGHQGLLDGNERSRTPLLLGRCRLALAQERIVGAMPIFQPELETLPRPELERLQRERLRERFGVELEELPEQPFRVKSDLRDAYPFGLLQVPLEECVRIHASSGTAARRRSSRTRGTTSRPGPTAAPARWRRPAPGRARSSTSPTATASSPAASASTTAPSGSAAPSSPRPAATRRARRSCSRISAPRSSAARRATRSRSPTTSPSPHGSICAPASSAPSRGPRGCARRSRARSS